MSDFSLWRHIYGRTRFRELFFYCVNSEREIPHQASAKHRTKHHTFPLSTDTNDNNNLQQLTTTTTEPHRATTTLHSLFSSGD
jgi:hypothetical protein